MRMARTIDLTPMGETDDRNLSALLPGRKGHVLPHEFLDYAISGNFARVRN